MNRLQQWSLWLVGLGLMIASSGTDGAYMARWMADLPGIGGAAFLGYVLNTTSDVASLVLTYWYGRLQMDRSSTKRRMSHVLLGAEAVAVAYSWFFGYRQLRLVLPAVEGDAAQWVAPIAAGFIPLLIAFVGYAQALLAGRIDAESPAHERRADAASGLNAMQAAGIASALQEMKRNGGHTDATDARLGAHRCDYCGRDDFASPQALSAHLRFCAAYRKEKKSDG